MTTEAQREAFEAAIWAYYQRLKANGWSHPEEGDTSDPAALFWREPSGKYGVAQIEAAWWGWRLKALWAADAVVKLDAVIDEMHDWAEWDDNGPGHGCVSENLREARRLLV